MAWGAAALLGAFAAGLTLLSYLALSAGVVLLGLRSGSDVPLSGLSLALAAGASGVFRHPGLLAGAVSVALLSSVARALLYCFATFGGKAMKYLLSLAVATAMTPVAVVATPADAAAPVHGKAASSVTLTVADNGRQVRVHQGERVLVRLSVNPRRDADPTTWWRAVDESGDALQARPQTAIAIRGLTRARYQAVAPGEATLSSSRAVCPQHNNGPTCHAMQGWSVTVDVR